MEGLLILIAIVVIDAVIKGAAKKRKQQQQLPRQGQSQQKSSHRENYENEETGRSQAPRSLQDLIRQFQEAQREASQGTYVPSDPSVDEDANEEGALPVVRPANPGHYSFTEIAESVIQWEEVCVSYLQEAFGFSKATAAKVLAELQKHKIVGRDMGDGFCDILVHDKVELSNLFKREQAEAKKQMEEDLARKKAELKKKLQSPQNAARASSANSATTAATNAANDVSGELERQRQLNELESRAREAREQAGTDLAEAAALASTAEGNEAARRRAPLLSTKNIADIRRGFLWAKVIDEPRFKKRWSAQVR